MDMNEFAALAEDRSRFFWWLADWFLSPPSAERLAGLPEPDALPANADGMDRAWHDLALAKPASADPESLAIEHTRLFSGMQEGMGPPPPYESVWREDRLVGESTVAAIETYLAAGFADIDPAAGPQDHIAVELKFIALLALREAETWRANNAASARDRLGQQHAFLDRHLMAWAPRWAETVARQAQAPLYGALAQLVVAGLSQTRLELSAIQAETA
jgi:TorA maturation chaperone TorD